MATRNPFYKANLRPIVEKKRRRSELVMLWHVALDGLVLFVFRLREVVFKLLEIARTYLEGDKRERQIRRWLQKHLKDRTPGDFSNSWRDGLLLCELLNILETGCCPNKLNPDHSLTNVQQAFDILELRFKIKPVIAVWEIITCCEGSDSKLLDLLLKIKLFDEKGHSASSDHEQMEPAERTEFSSSCIAKGTGLMVGFVGRPANFMVIPTTMLELDLVIEIKSPSNAITSERITSRSPRKKRSVRKSRKKGVVASYHEIKHEETGKNSDCVSFEYEFSTNQINFSYYPVERGIHVLSILWYGSHAPDSPFTVTVESDIGAYKMDATHPKIQQLKEKKKNRYNVIRRRVIKFIVRLGSRDVAVEANSVADIATALLRMDYDMHEKAAQGGRRNSWGFTGDAQRKISAIRQFCLNPEDTETPSSKFNRSQSFSNEAKRSRQRSNSLENRNSEIKLETLSEGCSEPCNNLQCVSEDGFACKEKNFESSSTERNPTKNYEFDSNHTESNLYLNDCQNKATLSKDGEIKLIDKDTDVLDYEKADFNCNSCCEVVASHSQLLKKVNTCDITDTKSSDSRNNLNLMSEIESSRAESSPCQQKNSILEKICFEKDKNLKSSSILKESDINLVQNKEESHVCYQLNNCNLQSKNSPVSETWTSNRNITDSQCTSNNFSKVLDQSDVVSQELNNECKHKLLQSSTTNSSVENSQDGKNGNGNNALLHNKMKDSTLNSHTEHAIKQTNRHSDSIYQEEVLCNQNIVQRKLPDFQMLKNSFEINTLQKQSESISTNMNEDGKLSKLNNERKAKATNTSMRKLTNKGQVIFKHFNTPLESFLNRTVKNRIKRWEIITSNCSTNERQITRNDREKFDIKSKLKFWQSTCNQSTDSTAGIYNVSGMCLNNEKRGSEHKSHSEDTSQVPKHSDKTERNCFGGMDQAEPVSFKNSNKAFESISSNIDVMCQIPLGCGSTRFTKLRSFSDPGVASQSSLLSDDKHVNHTNQGMSDSGVSNVCEIPYDEDTGLSFVDSDLEDAKDNLVSESDACQSTEDEYIDDEISESTSAYWGDLSIVSGMKRDSSYNSNVDDLCGLLEIENTRDRRYNSESDASMCKVFGIANYFGYVAEKNRFHILTREAGNGSISACMRGFGRHDVSFISVKYVRKDVYEVTYQVTSPGLYLISVRWRDNSVQGSPFLCKITY